MDTVYRLWKESSAASWSSWIRNHSPIVVATLHSLLFILAYTHALPAVIDWAASRFTLEDATHATQTMYGLFFIELLLTLVSAALLVPLCKQTPCELFLDFAIAVLSLRLITALIGGTLVYVSLIPCLLVLSVILLGTYLLKIYNA